ncbi:hypothetical protein M514_05342 [Trichuris suis]|uniref:Uncharacterized protein n=1 Tax=Trichuris suis TaxID=68888 RepID=A0A085M9E0_9BILA|nr:hypothetical protein M513_05342 [Trichuris suis]KFD71629.1 hypothetical protein M514_05342 [Trichuris suis]
MGCGLKGRNLETHDQTKVSFAETCGHRPWKGTRGSMLHREQAMRKRDGMKTKPPLKGTLGNTASETKWILRASKRMLATGSSHFIKYMVADQ